MIQYINTRIPQHKENLSLIYKLWIYVTVLKIWLALKKSIKDLNILQELVYEEIMKKIDGPEKYGMGLKGLPLSYAKDIV